MYIIATIYFMKNMRKLLAKKNAGHFIVFVDLLNIENSTLYFMGLNLLLYNCTFIGFQYKVSGKKYPLN